MDFELNPLISELMKAAAVPNERGFLKDRIFEIAKLAQIVPQQHFLLQTVAGSMASAVEAIFGPLSLIVILTEQGRRQIYFAVIARLLETGMPSSPDCRDDWRIELIERLLSHTNENLIEQTYGDCPPGFISVLKRLGDTARQPNSYIGLFNLLKEVPGLAFEFPPARREPMSNAMIELLVALPRVPQAAYLAKRFEHIAEYRLFMNTYQLLTAESILSEEHVARICSGEPPAALLESLYLALPFGPPALSAPDIRYFATGAELIQASVDFHNCLRNYVPEAIRGERQYYVWEKQGEPAVIFCLSADRPFGWHLSEYRLVRNRRVPDHLGHELKSILELAAVRIADSLENQMSHFLNRLGEVDNRLGEVDLVDLLEIEAA